MKKILSTILALTLLPLSIYAAFSPTYEKPIRGEFTSPARIADMQQKTPFAFEIQAGSDIDALSFYSNPSKMLGGKPAEELASYLAGQDLEFWQDNPQLVQVFSSLDDNFPSDTGDGYYLASIRNYFANIFLSETYGDARRAYAVMNSMPLTDAYPYNPYRILGGDTYLSLEMYGGEIKNNFGWNWDINMDYDGASSLLNHTGGRMSVDARANIAYAFSLNNKFSLGVSVQPMIRFQMDIPNEALISARMNDEILYLFTDDLMFGTGLSVNIGTMYEVDEDLAFTIDFRNVPSFRNYALLPVSSIAEGNAFLQEDDTIYYIPPDVALSAFWDRGSYHLQVEISDIINQAIYDQFMEERKFDYYSIMKLSFTYDLDDDLSLTARYRYRALGLGIRYKGMEAELMTKLDRAALGISFGWIF